MIRTTQPDSVIGFCADVSLPQLNTEYLAGACCVCKWDPLSSYTEDDLEYLRDIADSVQSSDDLLYVEVYSHMWQ